jgi:N-acyl-D-aspartate/D-glutamate deacylase
MGMTSDIPNQEELIAMKSLVCEAMDQGALGMSTGLIYPPGMYSQTEELIDLAAEVAQYNGIYTSHIRGASDILIPSVKELLKIGRETGIHIHHSHHGAVGKNNWGKLDYTVAMEEEARDKGLMVTFDVIPYNAAATGLGAIFPPWSMERGGDALIRNLADQGTREQIRWEIENTVPGWPPWIKGCWGLNFVRDIGWENIDIATVASEKNKVSEGLNLMEYGASVGKTPFDAAADLMIEEQGNVGMILHGISGSSDYEEPINKMVMHPMGALITDAWDLGRGKPHPAAYGAFPRVLHHFVKEKKILRLEEAIRKMTSFPAQVVGIYDRGLIRESMMADLLVIDMEAVRDNATYESPRELRFCEDRRKNDGRWAWKQWGRSYPVSKQLVQWG